MSDENTGLGTVDSSSLTTAELEVMTGRVLDALTELYRLDLELWGDSRTAQVVRCVAAANYKDGRAAKLSAIATSLELGLATVHQRLKRLETWRDCREGQTLPLVRQDTAGYWLTTVGEERLQRWLDIAASRPIPRIACCVDLKRDSSLSATQ
jgi:hypothetical protein